MEISNEKLFELALASLGPQYREITLDQYEAALVRRISLMRAVCRPSSPAMQVFDSQGILGTITSVEHEAKSNRSVIHFVSQDGKEESIRTPRLETTLGRQVTDQASECIGSKVIIAKVLEKMRGTTSTVRVAYDIQPLR